MPTNRSTWWDSVVPKNCIRLNLWGNHENWILRDLLAGALATGSDTDAAEFIVNSIFEKLKARGVLWVEMDERTYLPLTEHFWVGHGRVSRSLEGSSARAYMTRLKGAVSLAVGHTHRQEVLWARLPVAQHFYAITGTLGLLRNVYANHDFLAHNWGLQLIEHPIEGWKGVEIDDIEIHYRKGYYVAKWRGKEYSEKATFDYDPLLDLVEIGMD